MLLPGQTNNILFSASCSLFCNNAHLEVIQISSWPHVQPKLAILFEIERLGYVHRFLDLFLSNNSLCTLWTYCIALWTVAIVLSFPHTSSPLFYYFLKIGKPVFLKSVALGTVFWNYLVKQIMRTTIHQVFNLTFFSQLCWSCLLLTIVKFPFALHIFQLN